MRAGNLNKLLSVEENSVTAGGSSTYYQDTEGWTEWVKAWAEVDSGPSRKWWAVKQLHQEASHVVTIRWWEGFDVTKEIRFVWTDSNDYEHTVYPLGPPINRDANANRWLEFACKEQVQ